MPQKGFSMHFGENRRWVPLKNKLTKMLARKEKTIKNGSTWWVFKMGWKGFFAIIACSADVFWSGESCLFVFVLL